jgi:hypothetical protein
VMCKKIDDMKSLNRNIEPLTVDFISSQPILFITSINIICCHEKCKFLLSLLLNHECP